MPHSAHAPKRVAIEQRWGRPIAAVLMDLYLVRGLSEAAVARELGVVQPHVHRWLVRYGIPRRTVRAFPTPPVMGVQKSP
jgi:hypothetical protein